MKSRLSGKIDFERLTAEQFEALVNDYLVAVGMEVTGRGRGADDGVDMIAVETRPRAAGSDRVVTIVQCKHYTSKAVSVPELTAIPNRCRQHHASAYLLVCSGPVSSAVWRLAKEFNEYEEGPRVKVWDGSELERLLAELDDASLLERYFGSADSRPAAPPIRARGEAIGDQLIRKFSLLRAVVCDTPAPEAHLYQSLGAAAAQYFYDNVPPNAVVGVSCGNSIFAMADSLPRFTRPLRVYPISFNVGPSLTSVMSPWVTIFRIWQQVSGAEGYELPIPAFVVDPEREWEMLLARPDIRELVERCRQPTVAFYSVGHLESASSYDWAADRLRMVMPGFSPAELRAREACGEINWYPFAIDGSIIDHPIVRHGTSLGLPDIRTLAAKRDRQMVLVAGGRSKVKPIVGALRGGFLNVLISDQATVKEVAEHVL